MTPSKRFQFSCVAATLCLTVAPLVCTAQGVAASALRVDTRTVSAQVDPAHPAAFHIEDRTHTTSLQIEDSLRITAKDGTVYSPATNLHMQGKPSAGTLPATLNTARKAAQLPANVIREQLISQDGALGVEWSLIAVQGTNYLREVVTLSAMGRDLSIQRVQLLDLALPGAHVAGSVSGSPVVTDVVFAGIEHPMAHSAVQRDRVTAWVDRELPLRAGQSVTYSLVIGVARPGQLRRGFLAYLETERAHPYRTFLHYNSWYDLGFFNPYDQAGALDRIQAFGRELTQKRGVKLDSFLFDDGWDNHASLWKFNAGFPNGFLPLKQAAEKVGAHPGVWMSPWGGYDGPKKERIAFGAAAGYEIVKDGYALSGPKYYAAFRDVCIDMIRRYGVNQFKFDGTGNADSVVPGSQFDSDFAAAIHLIGELRAVRPDVFVNVTTGTWPSPFWLLHADSIWRGGEDESVAGVGPYRERWITYRDAATYKNIVKAGPLFPLNSLMLHGMIFAQHHKELDKDPGNDFRNEVRSYFGTGTQLQEMYITPGLLSSKNWDDLAEAAQWSRSNAAVLKDTHWIGGDPAALQVYGWAAWSPQKGIMVLRNPSDRAQQFSISLHAALELQDDSQQQFAGVSPWKDAASASIKVNAREQHTYSLAPFEVLTLEFTAQGKLESAAKSK